MYIRISEPDALPDLMAALNERVRYVVEQTASDTIAISVLGSFADGGKQDVDAFLAEWQAVRPGVIAECEHGDPEESA